MAFGLNDEQKQFIGRMIRNGRFNSQSEVVREALRRMQETESDYLNPPPLTPAQVAGIYGRQTREDAHEQRFGRVAFAAVKRATRKGVRPYTNARSALAISGWGLIRCSLFGQL
jgi:Arc/MetJ-type ribon-helix-helix transcriptional regulator